MKTVAQIIEAARRQFKPNQNSDKRCGRRDGQKEGDRIIQLAHAFESQADGSYKKRGIICNMCSSQLSKKEYLFIPVGIAAELTIENMLLSDATEKGGNTSSNGGGQGEDQTQHHKDQHKPNPQPAKKTEAKAEAPNPQPPVEFGGQLKALVTTFGLSQALFEEAKARIAAHQGDNPPTLISEITKTHAGRVAVAWMRTGKPPVAATVPAPRRHKVTNRVTAQA